MELIREPPPASTFVPLADHQSTTPASFYTGPPVLHYHSGRSKVVILERDPAASALLAPLLQHATNEDADTGTNGHADGDGGDTANARKVLEDVDVWVAST
jgi:chloride channel, nucleotide-sensitive, 1A